MIKIIVAYDENFLIGNGGKIPWQFPEDMQHFKETTENNSVIMGRKTWESIPEKFRPLPKRFNCVLTRRKMEVPLFYDPFDPTWCSSIKAGIRVSKRHLEEADIYIMGGGEIYRHALEEDIVDEILASEVKGTYEGDVYFPNIREMGWTGSVVKEFDDFDVVKYTK